MTCIPHDEPFAFVSATVSTFTLGWFLDRYPFVIVMRGRAISTCGSLLWWTFFYVSEASATRHTLQPFIEGKINDEPMPLSLNWAQLRLCSFN